jgi:hypothetical protein
LGGEVWGIERFIGIRGYRKGCLVKKGVSFIGKIYWEGGSTKVFLEVFNHI